MRNQFFLLSFLVLCLFSSTAMAQEFDYDSCTWIINEEGKLALDGSMYIEGLDQYVSMTITINAKFIKVTEYDVNACFDDKCIKIASHNGEYVYFVNDTLGKKLYEAAGYNNQEKVKIFKDAVLALKERNKTRAVRAQKIFDKLHAK